jgi:hypothetical protein
MEKREVVDRGVGLVVVVVLLLAVGLLVQILRPLEVVLLVGVVVE